MSTVGRRVATLVAALSLVVVGCGGVGGGDEQPQANHGGGEMSGTLSTLRVQPARRDRHHPGRRLQEGLSEGQVKITEGGFDEQQFLSAVASGSPPDLVYVDREIIGTYAASGAIQPLDDCASEARST